MSDACCVVAALARNEWDGSRERSLGAARVRRGFSGLWERVGLVG